VSYNPIFNAEENATNAGAFSTASLGMAIGRAIPVVGSFAMVPSLQGGIARRNGGPIGIRNSTPHTKLPPYIRTFGELGVGLGFRLNDVLTVRLSYATPFAWPRDTARVEVKVKGGHGRTTCWGPHGQHPIEQILHGRFGCSQFLPLTFVSV